VHIQRLRRVLPPASSTAPRSAAPPSGPTPPHPDWLGAGRGTHDTARQLGAPPATGPGSPQRAERLPARPTRGGRLPASILSAVLGLVAPGQVIAPCERTLNTLPQSPSAFARIWPPRRFQAQGKGRYSGARTHSLRFKAKRSCLASRQGKRPCTWPDVRHKIVGGFPADALAVRKLARSWQRRVCYL
jgi:hypothetical protein